MAGTYMIGETKVRPEHTSISRKKEMERLPGQRTALPAYSSSRTGGR